MENRSVIFETYIFDFCKILYFLTLLAVDLPFSTVWIKTGHMPGFYSFIYVLGDIPTICLNLLEKYT